jgi:hypothetical protein
VIFDILERKAWRFNSNLMTGGRIVAHAETFTEE